MDYNRRSEVNKNTILNETNRRLISARFANGMEWKTFAKSFAKNTLSTSTDPRAQELKKSIENVISYPDVIENIKTLQHCLGMFDEKSSGGVDPIKTLDHMGAQDGILGPITLGRIKAAISVCIGPAVPKAPVAEKAEVVATAQSIYIKEGSLYLT